MNITVLSLFPTELNDFFIKGLFSKAFDKGLFKIDFLNIRDFASEPHYKVDDHPFGGKRGMLIKADILYKAVISIDKYKDSRIIYTCPKGKIFGQKIASQWSAEKHLIFICGYYEGVDERIFDLLPIEKISIGDFILSSGELPALLMIEATLRLLPGVVGNPTSIPEDSIISGLLEYPQYTMPREIQGITVPEILVSGHHPKVNAWRTEQSLRLTLKKKPNLLMTKTLTITDKKLLTKILKEED